jgi:abortive infection bacteriophage resistance protein
MRNIKPDSQPVTKPSFRKQAKTIEEHLELLKLRGMFVSDDEIAKYYLKNIGYHRLSGYWFLYQEKWLNTGKSNITNEDFVVDISFDDILTVYKFDRELRRFFMDAFERIEIAVRANVSDLCSIRLGSHWCFDDGNYRYINKRINAQSIIYEVSRSLNNQKETPIIKHFYNKYSDEFPPSWITFQFITFGTLSKIYSAISDKSIKFEIADSLELNIKVLESGLKTFAYARNICAHYGRFWNNEYRIMPIDIHSNSKHLKEYNISFENNKRLFPVFYYTALFMRKVSGGTTWFEKVLNLIDEYSAQTNYISREILGFPEDDKIKELKLFDLV